MWKKFLAVTAVLAILSTNAMALSMGGDVNAGQVTDYISNFVVSPEPFDPVNDGAATVSFDLLNDADMYAYVMDSNSSIVATLADYQASTVGAVSYTWYGTTGNTSTGALLADGEYQVKAFAVDPLDNAVVLDFDFAVLHLDAQNPQGGAPVISNLDADPDVFSVYDGETTNISFEVSEDAYLTVEVRDGGTAVKTYTNYDGNDWYTTSDVHSILWDGEDNNGVDLADGTYTVYVYAVDSSSLTDTETFEVQLNIGSSSNGVIEDFDINPRTDWDPSDDELEIEFELSDDVDDLTVEAIKDGEVIEIMDENNADDGDYEELWDGTDEDGDYVEEGIWTIRVTADGDVVSLTTEVDYYTPQIITAFVTKSSIDVERGEFTNLVFEIDEDAVVTVEIYDGSRREATLMDEEEVESDTFYAVMWDGSDNDGDEMDEGDYYFKITAENPVDDDIYSTETVDVDIDEDDISDSKSNATNDFTDPVVFDENGDGAIEVSYCLDQSADVYLAVYDGTSTTGTPEIELLDYAYQTAGCHTVAWNGKDDKGRDLEEGVNSYKLITKIGSYKDTETGKFAVGEAGDADTDPELPPYFYDANCNYYYSDLFSLDTTSELCQAIAWGTDYGIWDGYPDGSFKPYDVINRAEVLKVALETFNVEIMPTSGTSEGFSDVSPYAWYMPYVRTAKFYGMFDGHPDGTARLSEQINRVELLKVILEASDRFTNFDLDDNLIAQIYADVDSSGSDWYYRYANTSYQYSLYDTVKVDGQEYLYPGYLSYRGDVAILLYRMYNAGLLTN
jgi:flagellar hook assembly protein FlgD